jgi:hypothetical protein
MGIAGFKDEKCTQRERILAGRYGQNAVPMRFVGSDAGQANGGVQVLKRTGALPTTAADTLAAINSRLPEGATPLRADQVFTQVYEAANSNLILSRAMHLGESTLRNIATGAAHGVSFMNSHRTGGLSEPTELPFGQSFGGEFQEVVTADGRLAHRALISVFLVKGIHPNGSNGPSTDDIAKMFESGAVKDVSVGLSGGNTTCDVCGHPMGGPDAYQEVDDGNGGKSKVRKCNHAPGTLQNMSADQIESQKQRSALNVSGIATYTLNNSQLLELSAVYKGAVPGAGVQQIINLCRDGDMTPDRMRVMLQEAYDFYGELLPFDIGQVLIIKEPPADGDEKLHRGARMKWPTLAALLNTPLQELAEQVEAEDGGPDVAPAAPAPAPMNYAEELRRVEAQLAAERQRNAQFQEAHRQERLQSEAADLEDFKTKLSRKVTPAALEKPLSLYRYAQARDRENPVALQRERMGENGEAVTGNDGKPVMETLSNTDMVREAFLCLEDHYSLSPAESPDDPPTSKYAGSKPVELPRSEDEALEADLKAEAAQWVSKG